MNRENATTTTTVASTPIEGEGVGDSDPEMGSLDQPITPNLRLWMVLAMILGILLFMMVVVCCFIKIRIPRTKREIELDAAKKRKKRGSGPVDLHNYQGARGGKIIVMSSVAANQSLLSPAIQDPESASCTSCATSEDNRPTAKESVSQRQPAKSQKSTKNTTV